MRRYYIYLTKHDLKIYLVRCLQDYLNSVSCDLEKCLLEERFWFWFFKAKRHKLDENCTNQFRQPFTFIWFLKYGKISDCCCAFSFYKKRNWKDDIARHCLLYNDRESCSFFNRMWWEPRYIYIITYKTIRYLLCLLMFLFF